LKTAHIRSEPLVEHRRVDYGITDLDLPKVVALIEAKMRALCSRSAEFGRREPDVRAGSGTATRPSCSTASSSRVRCSPESSRHHDESGDVPP
jgi:hypothetical protein